MSSKKLLINISDFKKLHKAIKKLDELNSTNKIDNVTFSGYLSSALEISSNGNIDIDVKRAVLNTAGKFTTNPNALDNETLLKENLNFNDNDFASLTRTLNNILKIYNSNNVLNLTEVSKCKKVKDVILITKAKLN